MPGEPKTGGRVWEDLQQGLKRTGLKAFHLRVEGLRGLGV